MDTQFLRARFDTQEAAESAVRKLTSLRSDGIRLERASSNTGADTLAINDNSLGDITSTVMAGNDIQVYSGAIAAADVPDQQWRVQRDNPSPARYTPSASSQFSLSVNVPDDVADQARNVILSAGGDMS